MIWKKTNNDLITVKKMSNSYIKSNLNFLYKSNLKEINDQTIPFWILEFKKELNYRKQLQNTITNQIPWLCEKVNEITYNIKYKDNTINT